MLRLFSDMPNVKVSEKSIYKTIYQYGPITKNAILERLSTSLTTVTRFIDALEKNELIRIHNKDTAGGRNPVEYTINPTAYYAFGAYVTADVYGIALCDIAGNIIDKTSQLFQPNTSPAHVADFFARFIQQIQIQQQIDPEKILGLGFGIEGPIIKAKGILYHPYHLTQADWDFVPIKDLLEMKTGYPVWMGTNVEVALLCELVYHAEDSVQSAAYLRIDEGIGSAFYSKRIADVSQEYFECAVGHTSINLHGKTCVCGRKGCLETYASMDAIVADVQALHPELPEMVEMEHASTEELVWERSPKLYPIEPCQYSDEPELLRYFEELGNAFQTALLNFLYITRPQALYVAGRTVKQLPVVFDRVIEKLQQEYNQDISGELSVLRSDLQDELLSKGASFLVFNNYIRYLGSE